MSNQVLLITYDLKTPGKDYTPFFEALKKQGEWWHYLTNTWLIATGKSAKEVQSALGPHLTIKDFILIVPFSSGYFGYLPRDAWDWIAKHGGVPSS